MELNVLLERRIPPLRRFGPRPERGGVFEPHKTRRGRSRQKMDLDLRVMGDGQERLARNYMRGGREAITRAWSKPTRTGPEITNTGFPLLMAKTAGTLVAGRYCPRGFKSHPRILELYIDARRSRPSIRGKQRRPTNRKILLVAPVNRNSAGCVVPGMGPGRVRLALWNHREAQWT